MFLGYAALRSYNTNDIKKAAEDDIVLAWTGPIGIKSMKAYNNNHSEHKLRNIKFFKWISS